MGLRVITGSANAGKTGRLYERVREQAKMGLCPVILLPSMPDVHRAQREFAERGVGGVKMAVLDRWIEECWSLWGDGAVLVMPGKREELVARVVESRSLGPGVHESATKRGLVTALASIARRIPDPSAMRVSVPHDVEIKTALIEYRELCRVRGLIEPVEAMGVLAADPPGRIPPLYVNRFTDIGPAQERLLVAFSKVAEVWIALPWEAGRAATEALEPLVARLEEAGEHERVASPVPDGELSEFERVLFEPGGSVQPAGAVMFGEAPDEWREATLAVDICGQLIESGIPPSRIALTFRSADRRAAIVATAAAEAGVPLYQDVQRSLRDTSFGRALFALLDTVSEVDASPERIAGYAQSVYSGIPERAGAELDRRWRRYRVSGGALLRGIEELGGEACRSAAAARAIGREHAALQEWKYLADCLVRNAWSLTGSEDPRRMEDAAAHAGVLRAIASCLEVSGTVSPSEARTALGRVTVTLSFGDENGSVHFTEAHRVRATRYDAIIIGGLNADEFSTERDPSWASAFLQRVGCGSEREERLRERLLFYSLVTRARERLVLLRATGEAQGSVRRPSVFWEEAADLYRESGAGDGLPPAVVVDADVYSNPVAAAVARTPGRRAERSTASAPWRPTRCGKVGGEALERLRQIDEFSVTEIETYLSCPYRWFFDKVLNARELDREFGVMEQGSAAHEILARFYESWWERGDARRVTPELVGEAAGLAETVCEAALSERPPASGVAEECGLRQVCDRVRGSVEDDGDYLPGFEPCAVEFRFGSGESRPFEFGGVRLKGSVDRIDRCGELLVVTDYKWGSSLSKHADFEQEGLVQLPVYAAAAASLLEGRPAGAVYRSLASRKSVRGFWIDDVVDLGGWGKRTDPVDQERLDRLIDEAAERVARAAAGIRGGVIGPDPLKKACQYCGAQPVCREGREPWTFG